MRCSTEAVFKETFPNGKFIPNALPECAHGIERLLLLGVLCILNESIAHPTKHSWYPTFKAALALTENLNMTMVDAAYYIYDCLHQHSHELVLPDEAWMAP